MEKRRFKRKNIVLEAELIVNNKSHVVFIVNLSVTGVFLITAPLNVPLKLAPGTKIELNTQLSSGELVSLSCKIIWFQQSHPKGIAGHIGAEIISFPPEYEEFLEQEGICNSKSTMFTASDNLKLQDYLKSEVS